MINLKKFTKFVICFVSVQKMETLTESLTCEQINKCEMDYRIKIWFKFCFSSIWLSFWIEHLTFTFQFAIN